MKGMIKVSKDALDHWLQGRQWNQRELAKALGSATAPYDEGVLSKVINGEAEPSKQLMKKMMNLTGYDFAMFVYDRVAETKEED